MNRRDIIEVLTSHRRPGSPVYAHHFQQLPRKVLEPGNVPTLLAVLTDEDLPGKVREQARQLLMAEHARLDHVLAHLQGRRLGKREARREAAVVRLLQHRCK